MFEHAYSAGTLQRQCSGTGDGRPSPRAPLGVALTCVLALALVWVVVNQVPAVHYRDADTLYRFTLLSRPRLDEAMNFLLHLLDPLQFVLWGTALVALALARSRPRVAVAMVAVMSLAPLTAETLKPLLAEPHDVVGGVFVGPASWPSGHATAALSLVLAALLACPSRLRPLVAGVGAAFVLAVGCSLLVLHWHMPSDVLGGYLVATCWAALAVAALRASERRWPTSHPL
ncbi:MAG TPA: phosphatase PAP2 family protein [Solirubrobacteraceae bacterium]|jgi:membrane-associated phospholipid phosphatase|nr:phosphatase PAP2 family protein [Solirubrobacteraceae bacterium]